MKSSIAVMAASRVSTAFCVALLCVVATSAEHESELKAFYEAVAAGKPEEAVEIGKPVLERFKLDGGDARAMEKAQARLDAIDSARTAAAAKLDKIAQSAGSKSPNPLLYIVPQPSEMFQQIYAAFRGSAVDYALLPEDKARFVKSYVDSSLRAADVAVAEAYRAVTSSPADSTALLKSRAYLTAYVVGAHDESDLPAALPTVSEATGGAVPSFLAEDMLGEVGRAWAVRAVFEALEKYDVSQWPPADRLRILQRTAATARESEKDYSTALWAYEKLAAADDSEIAEGALWSIIEIRAEDLKHYPGAIDKCSEFLERFPSSAYTPRVKCRRILYGYRANDLDTVLVWVREVQDSYPDTEACAYATLMEAMVYANRQQNGEALAKLALVADEHPNSALAPQALLLSGIILLQSQEYSRALERFQRIVDFYPDSDEVERAKSYFDKLKDVR